MADNKLSFFDRALRKVLLYFVNKILQYEPSILTRMEIINQKVKASSVLDAIKSKGVGIHLNGRVTITHPLFIVLGNNVHIGDNAFFFTIGGLTIGDNTHISRNVTIYTASHQYEGKALPYDDSHIEKPVYIGKNVWIGMNVSIIPGVKIGEGAIVGMGTLVTRDVPAFSVIGAAPERVLKIRNIFHYKELANNNMIGGVNGQLIEREALKKIAKSASYQGENLVFAVGTGRCGSKALAAILNQHPEIEFYHEPKGQLIKLSTDYAHGLISREEVKEALLAIYEHTSHMKDKIYGESDQKLSNLIDILHEIFPKARFIWLVRNPEAVIRSTFSRGWFDDREFGYEGRNNLGVEKVYSGKIYSENRINGFKVKEMELKEWKKLTPFQRNCWYWGYWNKLIFRSLSKDGIDFKLVKLEELNYKCWEIIAWLKLPYYDFQMKVYNESKSTLIDLNNLSEEELSSIDRFCSEMRKILNY